MAILNQAALVAVIFAGCYAPEVRNCTVTCTSAAECANGEVCGADGFCAAPDVAGTCGQHVNVDGDAGVDGIANPDATPEVRIHIITHHGDVVLNGVSTCSDDCTFSVPADVVATLTAMTTAIDHSFMTWTGACTGANPVCTITPIGDVMVGAMFK